MLDKTAFTLDLRHSDFDTEILCDIQIIILCLIDKGNSKIVPVL